MYTHISANISAYISVNISISKYFNQQIYLSANVSAKQRLDWIKLLLWQIYQQIFLSVKISIRNYFFQQIFLSAITPFNKGISQTKLVFGKIQRFLKVNPPNTEPVFFFFKRNTATPIKSILLVQKQSPRGELMSGRFWWFLLMSGNVRWCLLILDSIQSGHQSIFLLV